MRGLVQREFSMAPPQAPPGKGLLRLQTQRVRKLALVEHIPLDAVSGRIVDWATASRPAQAPVSRLLSSLG